MSHRRHASSPVLDSSPPFVTGAVSQEPPESIIHLPVLRLKYPLPLVALGLIDVIYIVRYHLFHHIPVYLSFLSIVRAIIIGVLLGLSKSWRNRGGWMAIICGSTLGATVWQGCVGRLQTDKRGGQGEDGERKDIYSVTGFLIAVRLVINTIDFAVMDVNVFRLLH